MRKALIVTALRLEYAAVRRHLQQIEEVVHPSRTVYERGVFQTPTKSWSVAIAEVGAGNDSAAQESERAFQFLKPDVAMFVGIAGGIKDVRIGDVVAATKVYGYESGKADEGFKPRPEVFRSSYDLEQRAKAEAKKPDWLARLSSPPAAPGPQVFVAPIAAGEKVVASSASDVGRFLRASYSDAIAVEMEGRGFLRAGHANQQVRAIVIRGVSDLLDGKS